MAGLTLEEMGMDPSGPRVVNAPFPGGTPAPPMQDPRVVNTPLQASFAPVPGATLPKPVGLTPEEMGLAVEVEPPSDLPPVTASPASQLGYAATDLAGSIAGAGQGATEWLGGIGALGTMHDGTPGPNRMEQIHSALDPLTGGQEPPPGSLDEAHMDAMKNTMIGGAALAAFPISTPAAAVGTGLGLVGGALGPYLRRNVAEEHGEGWGTAAELAMSAGGPIVAEVGVSAAIHSKQLAKLVKNATKADYDLLARLNKYVLPRLPEGTPPITIRQLFEESGELKRVFPNTSRYRGKHKRNLIKEAIEKLRKGAKAGARGERARPTQLLGNEARRGLTAKQEALSDVRGLGDEFVSMTEGQEAQFVGRIGRKFEQLLPDGTPEEAVKFFKTETDLANKNASELWGEINLEDMPYMPAGPTLDRFDEILVEARGAEDLVPDIVHNLRDDLIREGTDELDMVLIQNSRAKLGNIRRMAWNSTDPQAPTRAHWAGEAMDELDRLIDDLPISDSAPYMAARKATQQAKALTDHKVPGGEFVRGIMKPSGAEETIGKLANKNVESARRAIQIYGGDPKALSALRKASIDEIFDSDAMRILSEKGGEMRDWGRSPKAIKKLIADRYAPLVELHGKKAIDGWIEVADWASELATDRLAKKGAVYGSGSSAAKGPMGAVGAMASGARDMKNPVANSWKMLERVTNHLGSGNKRIAMMQEMFYDPEIMAMTLEMAGGPVKPAYLLKLKQAGARAAARAGAQQTAR